MQKLPLNFIRTQHGGHSCPTANGIKLISLIVLIIFAALSIFGFAGMLDSADMAHAPNTCLASLAQSGACPPEGNTAASGLFHTSAFKVFSNVLLSGAIMLIGLVFLFFVFARETLQTAAGRRRSVTENIRFLFSRFHALFRLRYALALFELSPGSL